MVASVTIAATAVKSEPVTLGGRMDVDASSRLGTVASGGIETVHVLTDVSPGDGGEEADVS